MCSFPPPSIAITSFISLSSLISLTEIGKLHMWTPEGHLDSWHIARSVFQHVQGIGARPLNLKLIGLAEFFGFGFNAHDACADAAASWQVLSAVLTRAQVMQDDGQWANSTLPLISKRPEMLSLHSDLSLYACAFNAAPPPSFDGHIPLSVDGVGQWCIICYAGKREYTFVPCGHMCICKACADTFSLATCPLCSKAYSSIIQIYGIDP